MYVYMIEYTTIRKGVFRLTQSKGKHVGQRPAQVKHHMELAHAQHHPPPRRRLPKRLPHSPPKHHQANGIKTPQHGPHDELRMLEPREGNQRLAHARQEHRPDKRPWHGAGESKMIIRGREPRVDVVGGRAVGEDVVGGLEVEGFFDFGVGRCEEVQQRDGEEEEIYVCALVVSISVMDMRGGKQ